MFHKHLTFMALQTMKINFLLIICSWHPSYAVETGAIDSPKADLPSLTIMFDTLIIGPNTAKRAAIKIVDVLGGNQNIVIHNYTLVPFNEKLKYEPIITSDVNSTKAEIEKLKIRSKTYSAEAFYALEKCLLESHPPNPFVIMITDSKPGDDESTSGILSAVNKTQTRVVFLLSALKLEMMKYHPEMSNTKYKEIATASQGHISTYENNAGIQQALQFVFNVMNVTYEVETEKPPKQFIFFPKADNTPSHGDVV